MIRGDTSAVIIGNTNKNVTVDEAPLVVDAGLAK